MSDFVDLEAQLPATSTLRPALGPSTTLLSAQSTGIAAVETTDAAVATASTDIAIAAGPTSTSTTPPKPSRKWPKARRVRLSALASDASLPISGFGELVALAAYVNNKKASVNSLPALDDDDISLASSRARSVAHAETSPWSQFEDQMDEDAENRNIVAAMGAAKADVLGAAKAAAAAGGKAAAAALPITMSKLNVLGERRPSRHIYAEWVVLISLFLGLVVYLGPYRQKDRIWGAGAPLQPWITPAFGGSMGVAFFGWLVLLYKNVNWRLARTLASTMKLWTTLGMGGVLFFLEVCYPRTALSPFAGAGATMVLLMLLSLDAVQDKSRRFALYIGGTVLLAFGYNLAVLMFADDDAGIVLGTVSGREFTKQDVKANLFANILLLIAGGLGTLFNDRKQELLMFISKPLKKADVEAAYAEAVLQRRRARAEEERRERSLFSRKESPGNDRPRPNRRRSLTASTKKVLNAVAQAIAEALV